MSVLDRMRQRAATRSEAPVASSAEEPSIETLAERARRRGASDALVPDDLVRVRDLPPAPVLDLNDLVERMTEQLRRPDGTWRLFPLQALALWHLQQAQGLVAPIAVGGGKTMIGLLAPTVLGAKRSVYMTSATNVLPVMRTHRDLKEHWRFVPPERMFVMSYDRLSRPDATAYFERIRPDLLILDEAHMVRNPDAARTKRLIRFLNDNAACRVVVMSGTMTRRNLDDFRHLVRWALKERAPVPWYEKDAIPCGAVLDVGKEPRDSDYRRFAVAYGDAETKDEARVRFRRHFTTRVGVVASHEASVGASLLLRYREVAVPPAVRHAVDMAKDTWSRPDGETFEQQFDLWRYQQQLIQGFWYRWDWPEGKADEPWMQARSWFHKEVRRILALNLQWLDSPFLVRSAILQQRFHDPMLLASWRAWDEQRHKEPPPTVTEWIDDFLVRDAVQWAAEHPKGLVWYKHRAVAEKLAVSGLRVVRPGEQPFSDGKAQALSLRSHGTGLNLQAHHENLFLSFPSDPEQVIGRTHRTGQEADEVLVDFYAPMPVAWEWLAKAKADARYQQNTTGSPQKLLYATWAVPEDASDALASDSVTGESPRRHDNHEDDEEEEE